MRGLILSCLVSGFVGLAFAGKAPVTYDPSGSDLYSATVGGAVGITSLVVSNLTVPGGLVVGSNLSPVVTFSNLPPYPSVPLQSIDTLSMYKDGGKIGVRPELVDSICQQEFVNRVNGLVTAGGFLSGPGYWHSDTNGIIASMSINACWRGNGWGNAMVGTIENPDRWTTPDEWNPAAPWIVDPYMVTNYLVTYTPYPFWSPTGGGWTDTGDYYLYFGGVGNYILGQWGGIGPFYGSTPQDVLLSNGFDYAGHWITGALGSTNMTLVSAVSPPPSFDPMVARVACYLAATNCPTTNDIALSVSKDGGTNWIACTNFTAYPQSFSNWFVVGNSVALTGNFSTLFLKLDASGNYACTVLGVSTLVGGGQ